MDKITINELKGYLGTGLQMRHNYTKARHDGEKKLRLWVMELTFTSISMAIRNQDRKPLLYPLSSLTEYREDLGFVPIEELAKISDTDYLETIECKSKGNVFGLMYFDENGIKMVFNYSSETKSFASFERFSKKTFIVYKQLELFQKLYSWHIDLHGLIDRNLAINLKTLKDG
jgi:hypothetical protein